MIPMKVVSKGKDVRQVERAGKGVGGAIIEGKGLMRLMMTGNRMQLKEIYFNKGFYHPSHHNPGEESIGYVIKGRLKMAIGDKEYILSAGDCWYHPDGVFHWTRALEDTYAVEIHSPPRPEEDYYGS